MVTENINPPPAATPEPIRSRSVCVIGAGSAGLVAARELRREGHDVVVLEQNHDVGGQWLYEPNVAGEDPLGRNPGNFQRVHSSMYQCLRLQSPREVMGYSDFPFLVKKGRDMRRFPGHRELWLYLGDFAEWFGLREMVRFNTRVEYVGMVEDCVDGAVINGDDLRWLVKSVDKKNGVVKEQVFDAVVVATGHYSQPRLPSIKGMDTWKRKQLHSHIYRVPDPFLNEVVVVVGSSYSGQDISRELTRAAREVHMSARSFGPFTPSLSSALAKHPNLHLHPQIESLEEDGTVHFDDGSCVTADTIIHCTGYSYSFPFLDTKGIVVVDDDRVGPLYEHTFPPSLAPSLSFVGIPRKILGFPFFESQAKWIAQLLSGKRTLPSYNEMMKSIKEFYSSLDAAGVPKYNTHDIASFEYCDRYGDNSGYPHVEEWRKELTISAVKKSIEDWETFRDSWSEEDEKLLQEAFRSPHFTQLGLEVLAFRS